MSLGAAAGRLDQFNFANHAQMSNAAPVIGKWRCVHCARSEGIAREPEDFGKLPAR